MIHVNTWITTHLPTQEGWKAELAWNKMRVSPHLMRPVTWLAKLVISNKYWSDCNSFTVFVRSLI